LCPQVLSFLKCNGNKSNGDENKKDSTVASNAAFGGYDSQVKWGAHLVTLGRL